VRACVCVCVCVWWYVLLLLFRFVEIMDVGWVVALHRVLCTHVLDV